MSTEPPSGQRFSQVYLAPPSELLPDSARMRRRIGHIIGETQLDGFGEALGKALGITIDLGRANYDYYWPTFVEKAELRDVLDTITIRYRTLYPAMYDHDGSKRSALRLRFLKEVRNVFAEEQVRYRVDDSGGIHFTVDSQFEGLRVAALKDLGRPRYAGIRELFEGSFAALDSVPPDGKGGIRSMFFSVESLFRLMFPSAPQLNGAEVAKHLKPKVDAIYAAEKPAIYVAQKQIAAFREWIDGAHFYRHEPGTEEPAQPPLDLAIYIISQGAAHLRWLVMVDQKAT